MKKINIKGVIVSSDEQWIYDWFGIESISPKMINEQIDQANGDDLEVIINSGGGSVFDASEIYTSLKDYSGNVTVKIVGIAASAASLIAMAGNKVMMSPTSQMMIHNASTWAHGDYRGMDQASIFLKNVNQTIANAYSLKSGKSYDDLLSMMDAETWLTPQQALENKLVDEIMFEEQTIKIAASAGSMLPKEVIDKVRNEFIEKRPIENVVHNKIANSKQKEEVKAMDLEKLKNEHPEIYKQVKNEGIQEGITSERERIKAIDELAMPGNEELITKAKFETGATAEKVAMEIIKAEKERGKTFLNNREIDAKPLNQIEGLGAPQNTVSTEKNQVVENMVNGANQMRGVRK